MLTPRAVFSKTVVATYGVHAGAFDDNYYTNPPGALYFAAPRSTTRAELLKIALIAGSPPTMSTTPVGSWGVPPGPTAQEETSPLTEFKSGSDRVFLSVLTSEKIGFLDIGTALMTFTVATYPGGTSGIIVDNAVAPLQQASSIYFGTLLGPGTDKCGAGNYCAVKLTQSELK
jgi:hypothetical protein